MDFVEISYLGLSIKFWLKFYKKKFHDELLCARQEMASQLDDGGGGRNCTARSLPKATVHLGIPSALQGNDIKHKRFNIFSITALFTTAIVKR